jgi:glycosyltransferase involved in cell wall biosynthesis
VPLNEEDAFVERVCQLIENEELRTEMGMAGIKESKQYTMDNIIARWMSLFQELLNQKRKK